MQIPLAAAAALVLTVLVVGETLSAVEAAEPEATRGVKADASDAPKAAASYPLSEKRQKALAASFEKGIAETAAAIEADPKNVRAYSRRGDVHFFAGDFKAAVADYEKMVELEPELETLHWRKGIAYFYAGRYEDAARQFELYSTGDDVDRENGIWRFFSQAKAYGVNKAREGLLKYKKDDREPFPIVYELFAGRTTPDAILKQIREAELTDGEREKRLFYAQLYIGLNYAVEDQPEKARVHLREAVANTWGPTAGFGPAWMWHVGRVHYDRLLAEAAKKK